MNKKDECFIVENGSVRIVNTAIYAMQMLQKEMEGKAAEAGLDTEESINDLIREIRSEI